MLRKTLLIVTLVLGTVTPSYGQMPVIDAAAIAKLVSQITILNNQLRVLRDQYADMKVQASLTDAIVNLDTDLLLEQQAAVGEDDEILYGNDGSSVWNETFAFDETWEDGTWQEAALERDRAAWKTHRSLLRQLEMRQAAFVGDEERIKRLQDGTESVGGRNGILIRLGDIGAEELQQQRMTQQILLSLTNAVTVAEGRKVNDEVAKAAQERACGPPSGDTNTTGISGEWIMHHVIQAIIFLAGVGVGWAEQ